LLVEFVADASVEIFKAISRAKKTPGLAAGFETSDNLFYTAIWLAVWLQLPGPAAPTTFTASEYDMPGVSPLKV
jgi:hypothetical protein